MDDWGSPWADDVQHDTSNKTLPSLGDANALVEPQGITPSPTTLHARGGSEGAINGAEIQPPVSGGRHTKSQSVWDVADFADGDVWGSKEAEHVPQVLVDDNAWGTAEVDKTLDVNIKSPTKDLDAWGLKTPEVGRKAEVKEEAGWGSDLPPVDSLDAEVNAWGAASPAISPQFSGEQQTLKDIEIPPAAVDKEALPDFEEQGAKPTPATQEIEAKASGQEDKEGKAEETVPPEPESADAEELDDFGEFEDASGVQPAASFAVVDSLPASGFESEKRGLFRPDMSKLKYLYPMLTSYPTPPSPTDLISSTEARKAWYRLTRTESLREHNSASEDYVRISWADSKVRSDVVSIVSKWVAEESRNGHSMSGPKIGVKSSGAEMFGWGQGGEKIAKITSLETVMHAKKKRKERPKAVEAPKVNFGWDVAEFDPLSATKKAEKDAEEKLEAAAESKVNGLADKKIPETKAETEGFATAPAPDLPAQVPPTQKAEPKPVVITAKPVEPVQVEEEDEWGIFEGASPAPSGTSSTIQPFPLQPTALPVTPIASNDFDAFEAFVSRPSSRPNSLPPSRPMSTVNLPQPAGGLKQDDFDMFDSFLNSNAKPVAQPTKPPSRPPSQPSTQPPSRSGSVKRQTSATSSPAQTLAQKFKERPASRPTSFSANDFDAFESMVSPTSNIVSVSPSQASSTAGVLSSGRNSLAMERAAPISTPTRPQSFSLANGSRTSLDRTMGQPRVVTDGFKPAHNRTSSPLSTSRTLSLNEVAALNASKAKAAPVAAPPPTEDDDEGWGDFETVVSSPTVAPASMTFPNLSTPATAPPPQVPSMSSFQPLVPQSRPMSMSVFPQANAPSVPRPQSMSLSGFSAQSLVPSPAKPLQPTQPLSHIASQIKSPAAQDLSAMFGSAPQKSNAPAPIQPSSSSTAGAFGDFGDFADFVSKPVKSSEAVSATTPTTAWGDFDTILQPTKPTAPALSASKPAPSAAMNGSVFASFTNSAPSNPLPTSPWPAIQPTSTTSPSPPSTHQPSNSISLPISSIPTNPLIPSQPQQSTTAAPAASTDLDDDFDDFGDFTPAPSVPAPPSSVPPPQPQSFTPTPASQPPPRSLSLPPQPQLNTNPYANLDFFEVPAAPPQIGIGLIPSKAPPQIAPATLGPIESKGAKKEEEEAVRRVVEGLPDWGRLIGK